jgi:hypothetical protein
VSDLILDGENIGEVTVVAIGPEVTAVFTAEELSADAHVLSGLAHAALEDRADPKRRLTSCTSTGLPL